MPSVILRSTMRPRLLGLYPKQTGGLLSCGASQFAVYSLPLQDPTYLPLSLYANVTCCEVKNDHMITWYVGLPIWLSQIPRHPPLGLSTLPLLSLLGHRIASSSGSIMTKQVVWAACTLAFFTAASLGEFLASTAHSHDPRQILPEEILSSLSLIIL